MKFVDRVFRSPVVVFALGIFLLFYAPWDPSWQSIWPERWAAVIFVFGSLAIVRLPFRAHFAKAFLIYYLGIGLLTAFKGGFHLGVEKELIVLLREAALSQLLILSTFVGFLYLRLDLSKMLFYVSMGATIAILCAAQPRYTLPLLQNPSMGATFVVLASGLHPFAWIAVLLTRSYTAFLALLVGTLLKLRGRTRIYTTVAVGVAGVGFLVAHGIPDNGRFHYWIQAWNWFSELPWYRWVFGNGPGTSRIWLPYLGFLHPNSADVSDVTFWAHNDWLQGLLELGVVGITLGLAAFIELFWKSREKVLLTAYAVAMITNFPTHWALPALVGWDLVSRSLRRPHG